MKNIKTIIIILVSCLFISTPCQAATKQIRFKVTVTYKIQKGEKLKLYVKGHKKSKKVKWKSSNKKIATVSKKGVVTGKKGGTCKITATIGKKKYKVKIFVYAGENKKYEYDESPETPKDRYDDADIEIPDNTENPQYNEWMTEKELEDKGLSFIKTSNSTIHITGQTPKDSLTGMCKSYLLELPENLQLNIIYGDKLKFKWDGSNILYNTNDMKVLGLIVN